MTRRPRKPITIDADAEVTDAPVLSAEENVAVAQANVKQSLGGLSDALTGYGGAVVLLLIGAVMYFLSGVDDGD